MRGQSPRGSLSSQGRWSSEAMTGGAFRLAFPVTSQKGTLAMSEYKELLSHARQLRREMTKEERHLWYDFLRNYTPRFARQKLVVPYILDFTVPQPALQWNWTAASTARTPGKRMMNAALPTYGRRGYKCCGSPIWMSCETLKEFVCRSTLQSRKSQPKKGNRRKAVKPLRSSLSLDHLPAARGGFLAGFARKRAPYSGKPAEFTGPEGPCTFFPFLLTKIPACNTDVAGGKFLSHYLNYRLKYRLAL